MSEQHGQHDARPGAGQQQSGCCGGGKREGKPEATPREEQTKDSASKHVCCG